MTSFFRKLAWWRQRRRKEEELREELEFHLAEDVDERRSDGLTEDQARWAARRDLGNVQRSWRPAPTVVSSILTTHGPGFASDDGNGLRR